MATFAVIQNEVVKNKIIAETQEIAESIMQLPCIEYDDSTTVVEIGFRYENGQFIAPQIIQSDAIIQ